MEYIHEKSTPLSNRFAGIRMTEVLKLQGGKAYIALVTMVPAIVEALTGEDPSDYNHRDITVVRLSDNGHFRTRCEGAREHVIDLVFIPTIIGNYDTRSSRNISDLAARLQDYDLAVDACELSALYRRGIFTDDELERVQVEYPHLERSRLKDFLDYKKFLELVPALFRLMTSLRGRVVKPRIFNALTYGWGFDEQGTSVIQDLSYLDHAAVMKNWSDGKTSEGWAPFIDGRNLDPNKPIFNAVPESERGALEESLNDFAANRMETLSSRILLTDYRSDLAGMIEKLAGKTSEKEFISSLRDVFRIRREKLKIDTFPEQERNLLAALEDELEQLFRSAKKSIYLIDYFLLTGGPSDEPSQPELTERFRARFKKAFAFLRLWDSVEWETRETELNEKINGWYMSNSCYWMLKQAVDVHGLRTPLTSWAVTVLVTNSLGLVPDRQNYVEDITNAYSTEINSLVFANIPA